MNSTDYPTSRRTRPDVLELDQDMRPSDIADILRRLRSDAANPCCVIGIDRGVRNYLLGQLTAAHRK